MITRHPSNKSSTSHGVSTPSSNHARNIVSFQPPFSFFLCRKQSCCPIDLTLWSPRPRFMKVAVAEVTYCCSQIRSSCSGRSDILLFSDKVATRDRLKRTFLGGGERGMNKITADFLTAFNMFGNEMNTTRRFRVLTVHRHCLLSLFMVIVHGHCSSSLFIVIVNCHHHLVIVQRSAFGIHCSSSLIKCLVPIF
jgi:hypothetical protein